MTLKEKEKIQKKKKAPTDQSIKKSKPSPPPKVEKTTEPDWKEKYIRLYAENENSQKRLAREQLTRSLMANKAFILDLLPIIDDLERAIDNLQAANVPKETQKGLTLILGNLHDTLSQRGLTPIKADIGQEPNPEEHRILSQLPTKDEQLQGKITEVIQKGYSLHQQIIRPAQVITGK
ncbi:MAG: nucleotide exchange factor GrpE [Bacteroidota bacterium]